MLGDFLLTLPLVVAVMAAGEILFLPLFFLFLPRGSLLTDGGFPFCGGGSFGGGGNFLFLLLLLLLGLPVSPLPCPLPLLAGVWGVLRFSMPTIRFQCGKNLPLW